MKHRNTQRIEFFAAADEAIIGAVQMLFGALPMAKKRAAHTAAHK
jgi:hypothetical protein